jgi:hypothetical protein
VNFFDRPWSRGANDVGCTTGCSLFIRTACIAGDYNVRLKNLIFEIRVAKSTVQVNTSILR